jgi:hypothetical protein
MESTIIFRAEATLIEQARAKATSENRTLNDLFQDWLRRYVQTRPSSQNYAELMRQLQHVSSGRKFSREEANER